MDELFLPGFSAEPADGLHPARETLGLTVLVRGPPAARFPVERRMATHGRVTANGERCEILEATVD
eukprot:13865180-Alexandrium_andersonii.AAC.1